MNVPQMEMTKKRTLRAMELLSKLPKEELRTSKHDEEIEEKLKEEKFPLEKRLLICCRKLLLAGHSPKAMSVGQVFGLCSQLPHFVAKVGKQNGVAKLHHQMRHSKGVHPLTQAEKIDNAVNGKTSRNKKRREALRNAHPDFRVAPGPIESELKEDCVKLAVKAKRYGVVHLDINIEAVQPMIHFKQGREGDIPFELPN